MGFDLFACRAIMYNPKQQFISEQTFDNVKELLLIWKNLY